MSTPIARSEVCPNCGCDIRCCKNCKHYSIGLHFDCKEHVDEHIIDKERANFCDWFSLSSSLPNDTEIKPIRIDAKAQFNSLFGD